MKYEIIITEEDISEMVRKSLKESHDELLSLKDRYPRLRSKKTIKALKRVYNYYSLPKDMIE